MHFSNEQWEAATIILGQCRAQGLMLATAESCTGGLVAALFTEIPGSSSVLDRGFVTYSNEAKTEMLGVPADLIESHGAVSPEVAQAMAEGALKHSRADLAIGITGIAGPGGGTADKPVGLVYVAGARTGRNPVIRKNVFEGDRNAVRLQSVGTALSILQHLLLPENSAIA